MSEENKSGIKDKLRGAAAKTVSVALAPFRATLKMISRILMLIAFNPITVGAVMFVVGARLHETGRLDGVWGKDLKGATVKISGPCTVGDKPRLPTLAEDEVIVTMIENDMLLGVVRKTRELVTCKLSETSRSLLPFTWDLLKAPQAIPELTLPNEVVDKVPDYKSLEKKTLLMSGVCESLEGKLLPGFTDEKIDVTSVEPNKEDPSKFILLGVKKTDQNLIRCQSSNIKYEEFREVAKNKDAIDASEKVTDGGSSFVGETLVVTGTCFPDERTKVNKAKRYLFYKLANTKLQVLEETLDSSGKLKKFTATALAGEFLGNAIVCDKARFPFIYQVFDPESTKLEDSKIKDESSEAPVLEAPKTEGADSSGKME